jgi:hypothetical protein
MKRLLILITIFSWALGISAQEKGKVKTVEDTYLYEIPSNVSRDSTLGSLNINRRTNRCK